MINSELRNDRARSQTVGESSHGFVDALASPEGIPGRIPRNEVHDLLEIIYCRVSPNDAAHWSILCPTSS